LSLTRALGKADRGPTGQPEITEFRNSVDTDDFLAGQ
jgi:hypothetical protein